MHKGSSGVLAIICARNRGVVVLAAAVASFPFWTVTGGEAAESGKPLSWNVPQQVNGCLLRRGAACSGMNLAGGGLASQNLAYSDFSGGNLAGATIKDSNLERADFSRSILSGAVLDGGYFRNARFRGAVLRGASMKNGRFDGADFQGVDFSDANLINSLVRDADLTGATGAFTCSNTDFSGSRWMDGGICGPGSICTCRR